MKSVVYPLRLFNIRDARGHQRITEGRGEKRLGSNEKKGHSIRERGGFRETGKQGKGEEGGETVRGPKEGWRKKRGKVKRHTVGKKAHTHTCTFQGGREGEGAVDKN